MELPKHLQEKVTAYVAGEMNLQEKENFENLLAENEQLKILVQEHLLIDSIFIEERDWNQTGFDEDRKEARSYIEFYNKKENQDFFDSLKKIQLSDEQKPSSNLMVTRTLLRISAVAAIFALALAFIPSLLNPNSNTLYKRYVQYEKLAGLTAKGESINEALQFAESSFHQKDYQLAADQFANILSGGYELDDLGRIYYALSLAEVEQYVEAENQLKQIINNDNSLYRATAIWYAGLIQVKKKHKVEAKKYINDYLATNHTEFRSQAKKLLKKLN